MDWPTLWNPLCGLDPWTLSLEQCQSAAATRAHFTCIWIVILIAIVVVCWYYYCHSSLYERFNRYVQLPMISEQRVLWCVYLTMGLWICYVAYRVWKSGQMWKMYRMQMDTLKELGLEPRDILLYMQQNNTSQLQAAYRVAAMSQLLQSTNGAAAATAPCNFYLAQPPILNPNVTSITQGTPTLLSPNGTTSYNNVKLDELTKP